MLDPEIQQLVAYLSTLPTPMRSDIIRKIKLFAESDAKPHQTNTRTTPDGRTLIDYLPPLSRLDVVHCDFTGVGYEWDGPHYAVVWKVNPAFDSVTVIPTTSESREEYANVFSVGQVQGLPGGNTTLLVADTTTVSRKRLSQVMFRHPKRGLISAKIPNPWLERIFQAMAVTFTNESTFQEFVLNHTGVAMPADVNVLIARRFVPVRASFDSGTAVLNFRMWNQDNFQTAQFLFPKQQISVYVKRELIRDLFSSDRAVSSAAESRYRTLYH